MAEQETRRRKGGRLYKMVLILMVVLMAVVLGRQEYKIYRLHKEAEATRQRVEELQKVQADLQAERQRLADEAKAEEDAKAKRAANKRRREKIRTQIVDALRLVDPGENPMGAIADALMAGRIPNCKVEF